MIAINRILCAMDFSDYSRHALGYAGAMGDHYEAQVTALHVYTAAPLATPTPFGLEGVQIAGVQEINRDAIQAAAERFVAEVPAAAGATVRVAQGLKVADEVVVQAKLLDADLLVLGSHGRSGFERLLLGSVADRILRMSPRPVLIVPPHVEDDAGPRVPFKRIVCAVDFSDSSLRALDYALHLAQESDAHLTVMHAIELPPELHELLPVDANVTGLRIAAEEACRTRLDALVPKEAHTYCTIDFHIVEGKAHREILAAAAERRADLIVLGVQGRGAVDVAVFGSNTQSVVRGAHCPVLTVRT